MGDKVMHLLQELASHGTGSPDRLNYVHALEALVQCGKIDEAVSLVQDASPSSPLAFHVVVMALIEKGAGAADDDRSKVKQQCQALVECMVERHALIPDAVTEALLGYVSGEEGPKQVQALVGGGGQAVGDKMMGWEEVREKIKEDLQINPHDELKRMRIDALGHARLL